MFESLQTVCRKSSKSVVDGITFPSFVAITTGIRSVSGENLNRSLDRLLSDRPAGRESPSKGAVSQVAWFWDDMVQKEGHAWAGLSVVWLRHDTSHSNPMGNTFLRCSVNILVSGLQ